MHFFLSMLLMYTNEQAASTHPGPCVELQQGGEACTATKRRWTEEMQRGIRAEEPGQPAGGNPGELRYQRGDLCPLTGKHVQSGNSSCCCCFSRAPGTANSMADSPV